MPSWCVMIFLFLPFLVLRLFHYCHGLLVLLLLVDMQPFVFVSGGLAFVYSEWKYCTLLYFLS